MTTIVETPDQLLERLDRMGLERVKSLILRGHFEQKAMPLVKGWIQRKERELYGSAPEPVDPNQNLHAAVEQAARQAQQARAGAKAAGEAASKAWRMALIAITVAAIGAVVSIMSLFALAIR
jgi:hypothetical protein